MVLLPRCRCIPTCRCGEFFPTQASNTPELLITRSNGTQTTICLSAMDSFGPAPADAPQMLQCGPGPDTEYPAPECAYFLVWLDGSCFFRLFFGLENFPDCDCETGDYCDFFIRGWENYSGGCGYTIESIEIVSVGQC